MQSANMEDIMLLVFDELVGDATTLARVGLVSRSWRTLSLPFLFRDIDLSCHNNGRLPEHEDPSFPLLFGVVMSDYSDRYRPRNLVTRQRAFLRLMTERPELATKVKALAWTLVWQDFDDEGLGDIDLRTWDVFGLMRNVARLDLASLHEIGWEPFIRQNPSRLFPAVTHLRLVGWMHRGLVKAILSSLDTSRLVHLNLDHLQDEGALPNGKPMEDDWARESLYSLDASEDIDDDLFARQEMGGVAIFPGPMWYPLRLLREQSLASMSHLHVRLGPVDRQIDRRNYFCMFKELSDFIRR